MANLYRILQADEKASPAVLSAAYQALRADAIAHGDTQSVEQLDAAFAILGNAAERARYDAMAAAQPEEPAPATVAPAAAMFARPGSSLPAETAIGPATLQTSAADPGATMAAAESSDAAGRAVAEPPASGDTAPPRDPAEAFAAYQESQAQPSAPPPKPVSKVLVLGLAGMVLILIGALAVGLWFLLLKGSGDDYPLVFNEEGDDFIQFLAAMALRPEDVPEGIELLGEATFDNQEWSAVIEEIDPDAKLRQLNAQGRVRNFLSLYQSPALDAGSTAALGRPFSFTSQSSVFQNEAAARESLALNCDIELGDTDRPATLKAPRLGDQATAFEVRTVVDDFGNELIDTTVCFRTGRIVHSISQRGLEGTENLDLSIALARKMLEDVKGAFAGDRREPQDLQGGG